MIEDKDKCSSVSPFDRQDVGTLPAERGSVSEIHQGRPPRHHRTAYGIAALARKPPRSLRRYEEVGSIGFRDGRSLTVLVIKQPGHTCRGIHAEIIARELEDSHRVIGASVLIGSGDQVG